MWVGVLLCVCGRQPDFSAEKLGCEISASAGYTWVIAVPAFSLLKCPIHTAVNDSCAINLQSKISEKTDCKIAKEVMSMLMASLTP